LGDGQLLRSTPTLSQLENTEKKLLAIAEEILTAIELEVWRPSPSRLCDWCSFKSICPAFTS
ncbi:MAG: recombinase RecB, partial [Candidatus Nanopelagicaceae bacterium]|jgi:putative RecB family exonuclease